MSDLAEIQECLLDILKALPERPRRLKLGVGQVAIELDWPDAGQAGQVPPDQGSATAATASSAPAAVPGTPQPPGAAHVRSPSVGTFYRSPEPGAAPFVSEGEEVRPGQQVAIIEAMKLMLPVEADKAGRVVRMLKENGDPVEYGEPLMELAETAGSG